MSHSSIGTGLILGSTIGFTVLKLLGYIAWSWWWVFSPMWGVVVLCIALLIVMAVFGGRL